MVFEVDNTTKQLIEELQASIRETIHDIEVGQNQIKELIDEVKVSCAGLATADQGDQIVNDLAKTKTAIGRVATADQMDNCQNAQDITLELVRKLSEEVTHLKSTLPQIGTNLETSIAVAAKSQAENSAHLGKLIAETADTAAKGRVAELQSLSDKLELLASTMTGKMDELSSHATTTLKVVEANRASLSAITNYLSMPGYKRFFKGMEGLKNETAE